MVAVYRFDGSIPIGGTEGNFCVLEAEPSSGGKGKVIEARLQVFARYSLSPTLFL
jgi:hypothetical protein